MSSKIFLSSAIKFIPQKDFDIRYSENGGVEGHQTFLARKSSLGTSDLQLFQRGTLWVDLFAEVPTLYRNMTMKTFDPSDYAPGIIAIDATFTGYQYAGNGSSGVEATVPTSSLAPQMEEAPLNEHPKWEKLAKQEKLVLGKQIRGLFEYIEDPFTPDEYVMATEGTAIGEWYVRPDSEQVTTDEAKQFATLISQGRTTYKRPVWGYAYRTESENGFTAAQLNKTGKIVSNPEGNPADLGTGWTWLLTGPAQEQSGPKRFFKTLDYLQIQDNDDNQFLYGE